MGERWRRWVGKGALVVAGTMALGGCLQLVEPDRARPLAETEPRTTPEPLGRPAVGGSVGGTPTNNLPSGTDVTEANAERFEGSLGSVRSFSHTDGSLRLVRSAATLSARTDAEDRTAGYWVMTQVQLQGSLTTGSLVPGRHLHFPPSPEARYGFSLSVVGCAGPRRDNFTYDQPAREVDVDVAEGDEPGTQRILYTAVFDGPGGERQEVRGSFSYEVR